MPGLEVVLQHRRAELLDEASGKFVEQSVRAVGVVQDADEADVIGNDVLLVASSSSQTYSA
jgi:hypothetical protein